MQNEERASAEPRSTSGAPAQVVPEHPGAQPVAPRNEPMCISRGLWVRHDRSLGEQQQRLNQNHQLIQLTQEELRSLLLDVELLKRAMVSLGQVDVVDRQRIEKELILELFPPEQPRAGVGVQVHRPPRVNEKMVELDCARRLPLCKAACCRIFDIFLTPAEVESSRYDWNVRQPYALVKNASGCTYIKEGTCACTLYHDSRPRVCTGYSCARDRRIWADFDKRMLNPQLQERLKNLEVSTALEDMPASAPGRADGGPEQSQTMPTTPAHDNKSPLATPVPLPSPSSEEATEPTDPAASADATASAAPRDFPAPRAPTAPEPENKLVPPPPAHRHT